jgi:hypothetical protein
MSSKGLFLLSILGLVVTGCSSDKLVEDLETKSEGNAIRFNVINNLTTKPLSRATITNSSNITSTEFAVWALTSDSTFFMGKPVEYSASNNLGGVHISHNGSIWDYASGAEMYFWPTVANPLDFYAINPVTDALTYSWTFQKDKREITYTCINEYGDYAGTGYTNMDVMYAVKNAQTKNSNNGKVPLKFRHILSNISFKATTEKANMEVYLNEIKLHNVKANGVFTIPGDENKPTSANWTLGSLLRTSLTIAKDKDLHITNDSTTGISLDAPMLIVPQTLTKWDVANQETKTIAQANTAKQSYLEIACKIKQRDVYLFGAADSCATLYIPFGATFDPGTRYIYTIHFGGGYDENGNKTLTPITFDADTQDWDDID